MLSLDKDSGPEHEAAEELRLSILNSLSQTLSAGRRDYVAGRAASGIETEWVGDAEFYQGYDDANRHEFVNTRTKPEAGNSFISGDDRKVSGSTVFPNITQPYCDAASARVGDMLLPTDDRNFAIEPTPIPDMFDGLEDILPALEQQQAPQQPMAQQQPGQQPMQGMPPDQAAAMGMPPEGQAPAPQQPQQMIQMPDGQVMDVMQAKAEFDKMLREADRKAEKAQTHVDDWLTESQYHAELRMVIDDSAQIGSGVIKGPVPVKRKSRKWIRGEDGVHQLIIQDEINPASFRVDPWNLFPDPACGHSIHKGAGIWERDTITGKGLEELVGLPGYLESQIRICLREGPASHREADLRNLTSEQTKKSQYEIWYYHGSITADEMRAAGVDVGNDPAEKSFPAMITMVNDRVIRASLNPMDSGEFPYDVIPWKRRPGMPWGMGVARQMRTPQRIVVAATRNLMDNAGLASGPQLVVRRGVEPENGVWEITNLKVWVEGEDSDGAAASPVSAVVIPMILPELTAIITLGMDLAERVTGLPMLLQGQQGATPNTATGTQIMNNNGNSLLRRVARLFDSCVTEPHIRRYYAWLMEYGEDNDAKGDFQIVARGSTALVERDIQSQEMIGIVQLSLNPAYGLNPEKTAAEFLKSRRFDPAAFQFTDEEKKAAASQPPPEDPRITAAKIMAESKGAMQQADLQYKAGEGEAERAVKQMAIEVDAQLKGASLTAEQQSTLESIKADLSGLTMKLQVQRELSGRSQNADLYKHSNPSPQVVSPPTEPAGRAENGNAYAG